MEGGGSGEGGVLRHRNFLAMEHGDDVISVRREGDFFCCPQEEIHVAHFHHFFSTIIMQCRPVGVSRQNSQVSGGGVAETFDETN